MDRKNDTKEQDHVKSDQAERYKKNPQRQDPDERGGDKQHDIPDEK